MRKAKSILLMCLLLVITLSFTACSFVGCKRLNLSNNTGKSQTSTATDTENSKQEAHSHSIVQISRIEPTYESYGIITYKCSECEYCEYESIPKLKHTYSYIYSYDNVSHWYACMDEGYEDLKSEEQAHTDSNEVIIHATTDTQAGLAQYTCSICGHTYQKTIYLKTEILTAPSVEGSTIYVGQPLSAATLIGGEGSVEGTFSWTNPQEIIKGSGEYSVTFVPTQSDVYETLTTTAYISAEQLTVSVSTDENGSANQSGVINVNYGSNFTVIFTPNNGYEVASVIVDGVEVTPCLEYTFENITQNHTLNVAFSELVADNTQNEDNTTDDEATIPDGGNDTSTDGENTTENGDSTAGDNDNTSEESNNSAEAEDLPFILICESGTQDAYTFDGTTLTFTAIDTATAYSISGELEGNIVIDVGDAYKFDLELKGFTLTSTTTNPIMILSGDEVSLKAKSGYESFIYDNREAIDETDTTLYSGAVYSLVDLELAGKGSLTIVSENNNGVHTKDDLQVKNLTLSVTCVDNALKGNDSVEITNATTTLIATQGDCIKTTNSHINETTLNQKGTVSITGGTHNLYSACDAIDSAYNVVIDDSTTVLNIYTDKYSEYSEEVTAVSESTYYLRYTSTAYKYSVRYYNSTTGEYVWVNASDDYETVASSSNRPGGSSSTYYYYTFTKLSGYDKLAVYMYTSDQEQGQDTSYSACSSDKTVNESYDTVALSYRNSSLSVSWTNYSTSSTGGMQEGNSDKGTYSTKGIKAANEIVINEGIITIKAYDDAIHANNDGGTLENGEEPTGNVTINGGTITVYSNDDGIHADGTLSITNGTVNVTNAYEGIEGYFIVVSGGSVSVVSSDDGFNATSTTGAAIEISGGKVYVYATGDGLDSNSTTSKGAILFSGGDTVVICNSNGNSAIDSDGGYTHTAGRVVAIMTSGGMTSETTNGNTQGMTTKSSISLSNGGYLNVSVDSATELEVKMPCSITAYVVYIGSSSASISSSTTSSNVFDANGVYWKE